jgi:16S rRNA (guanine966-N2)-methyltransferase
VGARVLDLYSGTGALALEALSRGAAHATLVESARSALDAILANVDALKAGAQVRIVASSVERATRAIAEHAPFDLMFADPPYSLVSTGAAPRALDALGAAGLLADGAWLVLEHSSSDEPPEMTNFTLRDSRRYGDTAVSLYSVAETA